MQDVLTLLNPGTQLFERKKAAQGLGAELRDKFYSKVAENQGACSLG
jgi:hypothetical protein